MASLATRCLTAQQQQRVALPAAGAGQRRHNAAAAVRCSAGPRQSPFAPLQAVGVGALAAALLLAAGPASADLNRLEAAVGGEFGFGTAMQMGEADAKGQDFSGQNLQRSNFTSADCRDCNFSKSQLQAAYFMKSVLLRTNFEGADLSDALMDRAVIVEANLRDAVLQRTIMTRSDLNKADIYGADFTNALIDKTQQMALCKYADGVNSKTGISTRESLNCGSSRRFKASSPSNPEGPQVPEAEREAFIKSQATFRQ